LIIILGSLFFLTIFDTLIKTHNIMALEFTDANFEALALKTDKPVIVDFWAVWCGPCRIVGPVVEEIGDDFGDKVVVGKLDVDHNPETAKKYGIRNIPTLLFFKMVK